MNHDRRNALAHRYRDDLLEGTLPFWCSHAVDREHGGFMTCLGRDGSVIDTDKPIWAQGRFTWLLGTLYNTVEPRDEWRELALHGIRFLERAAFDEDGRLFFLVTRDGRPIRKRRYGYSAAFACMAYAAVARFTDSADHRSRARSLFDQFLDLSFTPDATESKVDRMTRPMKALAPRMIALSLTQTLRQTIGLAEGEKIADRLIDEIGSEFVKSDLGAVLETVGPGGEVIDHFDGRLLNPGHAIEAAWFVLEEARMRDNDRDLVSLGTRMLDLMWARGWDEEFGGLFYFRDLHDRPVQEYWHDMKFWWPHNETIIATLLAHELTGDEKYQRWHQQVHDWAHDHFPDREHGEWFGYLHRDGRRSSDLKGNHWKGPFHVPRMQLYCWRLLTQEST